MCMGIVKWFNRSKGYGFICPEDGGKDVFFHITQLEKIGLKSIETNQKISYETYKDRKRIAAGNLQVIN